MNEKESKKIVELSFLVSIIFIIIISNFCSTFSIKEDEYIFNSQNYNISNKYIENISPYTTIELYKKYFNINNCTIKVFYNDIEITEENYIPNGSKTILYDLNNNILNEYINIIKGDFNNDGIIDDKDYYVFGEYLVTNYQLEEYQIKSLDINNDNEVHINDLILLDKSVTLGYENISFNVEEIKIRLNEYNRIIPTIHPNYGINQNLVWSSSNNGVVTVDETGKIFGNNGGEATIKVSNQNKEVVGEVKVVVDNSIILDSYEGEIAVDGYPKKIHIDVANYDTIKCNVNNPEIANCKIENENLVITANKSGKTKIIVSGDKYKDAIYNIDSGVPYIGSYNKAGCNIARTQMFNSYAGELENFIFESSNPEVVSGAHVEYLDTGVKILAFDYGKSYGRAILTIKSPVTPEVLGQITLDHSTMKLEDRYKYANVSEKVTTKITGENLGTLTCTITDNNPDQEVATCNIVDNELIVETKNIGQADITVHNKIYYEGGWNENCGNSQFTVIVTEEENNEESNINNN